MPDKIEGEIPDTLYVEVMRNDNGWVSDKVTLTDAGDIIEVMLEKGKANIFNIRVTDQHGTSYECEPKEFSIIQRIVH